jgi:uncharacterized protein DUF4282
MANVAFETHGVQAAEHGMSGEKGLFESLFDLSFRESVGKRYVKLLYALHLFLGLVAAIVLAVNGFQSSPAQGLLALVIAVPALFLWALYVRLALEVLTAVLGIAENLRRATEDSGRH